MEIGSFIELQLPKGLEFYSQTENTARLNSGRAAIYHAISVLGCRTAWLPYYQCETVRIFLKRKGIELKYYHIDHNFNPIDIDQQDDEAVVLVNYFGVMSVDAMRRRASGLHNIIFDNSQAFFSLPQADAMNVYSARKFYGVPDGAYVIGKNAERGTEQYEQGYSSDTSLFLIQRVEYGCEGKTYQSRMVNEDRVDREGIMKMSALTHFILDGTDSQSIIKKRRENFRIATELFSKINEIDPMLFYDDSCVPMVYPLVVEDDQLLNRLLSGKHFQGHWWGYLLNDLPKDTFEHWLSRYVIPITIDQRYGERELLFIRDIVL